MKRKVIIINEAILKSLNDECSMTRFKFKASIKKFLAGLLEDPVNTQPDCLLTINGLDKGQLIKYLLGNKIINKKLTIDDHDSNGNPHTAKMIIKYSVPKSLFNDRLDCLYDILFPNIVSVNEDMGGATSCSGVDGSGFGSGEYVQPLFGGITVSRSRTAKNKGKKNAVGGDAFRQTISEGKKKKKVARKNDKGEAIPDTCSCGGKIGLYMHGEPVWLCSKCEKFYGTLPCPF